MLLDSSAATPPPTPNCAFFSIFTTINGNLRSIEHRLRHQRQQAIACPLMAAPLRSPPAARHAEDRPLGGARRPAGGGFRICAAPVKLATTHKTHLRGLGSVRRKSDYAVAASKEPLRMAREITDIELQRVKESDHVLDPFEELKDRFLSFKKRNCLESPAQFQKLALAQAPKFMMIACADSRVCPSIVLGLQPGEAFTVRNVANLIPPFQHGASETSAALEFAVNSLEVANILVVGHSRCGGIQALMRMKENSDSRSFIKDWVSVGKSARLSTKASTGHLSFEQQCRHCEKESVNGSLLNLLTYPWIEKRVIEGKLSVHGGYYDFVNCTFEKWTLVYREKMEGGSKYGMKDHSFWS